MVISTNDRPTDRRPKQRPKQKPEAPPEAMSQYQTPLKPGSTLKLTNKATVTKLRKRVEYLITD